MLPLPLALDAILGLILIELVVLCVWLYRQKRTDLVPALICFLLSGALLMLCVRLAFTAPAQSGWILALMALSFPVHLATLFFVWRAAQNR